MIALLLSAQAYELLGDDWSWQPHPIEHDILVNIDSFPASIGTPAEIELAVADGLEAWNGVARLDLHLDGTSTARWAHEGDVVLFFDETPADGAVIGTAAGFGWGGTLMDCDIAFWASNDWGPVDWDTVEYTWTTDIAEVTTHEIGHCLGFDHSNDGAASMRSSTRGWRGIAQDDANGLLAMYGTIEDADGDGYTTDDCDDANSAVHPGATEVCDGIDDDCDGAIDEVAASDVSFSSPDQLSADRSDAAWLALYTVDHDTALLSFTQELDLPHEMWVSFTVVDTTPNAPSTRTSKILRLPAGNGPAESPPMNVPLLAGHTYAIGAGVMETARFGYGPIPTADRGLTPLGGRWTSYAPPLGSGWSPHNTSQPAQVLRLADVDLDADGVTAFCGDCDDTDPNATDAADCAPPADPDPPESNPDGESGGCASNALFWSWIPSTIPVRRR